MFKLQGLGLASISFNQPSAIDSDGNAIGAPRIFTYQSNVDTVADISAANYFLNMHQMVTVGDVIYVQALDATIFLTFTVVSDISVTTTETVTITSGDIADGAVTLVKLAPDVFSNFLQVGNNLNDLGNVVTARGNLGLGSAALLDVTDFLRPSQNLSDVANKATSFNNISPITQKGDLIVGSGVNTATRLGVGTDTYFLQADSGQPTGLAWSAVSIPAGSAITKSVNQVAHGFSVKNILTFAGGVYVLAQADTLAHSQVVGMVNSVTDADNFVLLLDGYTTSLSGLTANTNYWLSSAVAGLLTSTEPSAAGVISRSLLLADSATSGYFNSGKSTFTTATWLQTANNLSDILSQSTARTNLGLGTAATHATGDFLQTANNLSDVVAATARTNLGLGTMAVVNSPVPVANGGTGASTPGATAANNIGALAIASNLSDLNSAATARTNLGLGTAATQNSTFFAQVANNLSDMANTATALSNIGGAASATTITIAGTANEITSSAGAQSLAANRTWTLSLPTALTFTGKTVTGGALSGVSATTFTFSTGSIGTAVTAVTQTALNNSTLVATTAYVDAAVTAGTGANTALSNLASVAINTALLPGVDNTIDLGDGTHRFRELYGARLSPGSTSGNTLIISGRNVGGASDTAFFTITSDTTTPTAVIASAVTGTTQSALDNSTKLATTQYVDSAVAAVPASTSIGLSYLMGNGIFSN